MAPGASQVGEAGSNGALRARIVMRSGSPAISMEPRMGAREGALLLLAALLAASGSPQAAAAVDACQGTEGCKVADGRYRLVLPAAPAQGRKLGAIMFFHGWQGSAEETAADPGLRALADRLGVALIAPDGEGRTWSYPGSPGHYRDEFAFTRHVLADVAARFPVDPGRVMASGFSQGASMVWYLACETPTLFKAYAPVAGAFWEPLPASCAPRRPPLMHFHGVSDTTVPFAGRRIARDYRQGDLFKSIAILEPAAKPAPAGVMQAGASALACRSLVGEGAPVLELCLHPGGHMVDPAWIERAWRRMMDDHVPVKP